MLMEITCVTQPLTIIPMKIVEIQEAIAGGQLRPTDQLIDIRDRARPGSVMAVIEPARTGLDRDDLIARLAAHCADLPTIRQPKRWDVIDTLPRHPNGKLRKVELRQAYRDRYARARSDA